MSSVFDVLAKIAVSGLIIYAVGVVYILISALLSILVGLILGYKITYFSFSGIMIRNDGNKPKITFVPIRFWAETGILKKDLTAKVQMAYESLLIMGMTICSVAFLYFGNIYFDPKLYVKVMYIALIVILGFNWLIYILFLKQALGKGEAHRLWEYDLVTMNKLKNGISPRDIEPIDMNVNLKDAFSKKCMLLNYYHYLDSKEYEKLDEYIPLFKNIIGDIDNVLASDMPYAYEIIYYYSIINQDIGMAEHYHDLIAVSIKNDNDLNGLRVRAGYLLGTNKPVESALELINIGLYSKNDNDNMIMLRMEKEMLSELKECAEERKNYGN